MWPSATKSPEQTFPTKPHLNIAPVINQTKAPNPYIAPMSFDIPSIVFDSKVAAMNWRTDWPMPMQLSMNPYKNQV